MKTTIKDLFLIGLTFITLAMMTSCESKEDDSVFCSDNSELFGEYLNSQKTLYYTFNYDCTLSLNEVVSSKAGEFSKGELVYNGSFEYINGVLNVQDLYWDAETFISNGKVRITEGDGFVALKKVN